MFTEQSFIPDVHEDLYATVLAAVVAQIPQDPYEVEIRYRGDYLHPVTLIYGELDRASLGKTYFLSGANWGPLDGVRAGSARLRIIREASCFMTFNSYPVPETCLVGLLKAGFRPHASDDPAIQCLQAVHEDELKKVLINRVLE